MLDIEGVQPDSVTFICPLREVFYFLYGQLSAYDLDPEYTFGILGILTDEVMQEEQSREPVGGTSLAELAATIGHGGFELDRAKQLVYAACDLIIQLVTQQIPNMGSPVYRNAHQYYLSPSYDLYISIQRSVFDAYEPPRIPPTGPRAYRL